MKNVNGILDEEIYITVIKEEYEKVKKMNRKNLTKYLFKKFKFIDKCILKSVTITSYNDTSLYTITGTLRINLNDLTFKDLKYMTKFFNSDLVIPRHSKSFLFTGIYEGF